MQHSDDPAIRELARIVDEYSEDISDRLSEMAFAAFALLVLLYRQISTDLQTLKRRIDVWADEYFPGKLQEYAELLRSDFTEEQLRDLESIVDTERTQFLLAIASAIGSIQSLASRFQRGQIPSNFLGLDIQRLKTRAGISQSDQATSRIAVRALLVERLVQVTGKGGRTYSYSFDYYVSLLAHHANQNIRSRAVLAAQQVAGSDLVRISPQPSTIGDFCDLYKGKVFSISGNDSFFHPLSIIPNGGCPMHPWCRHYLMPFDGSNFTQLQLSELREIPPDFILLGQAGASANEFQKLWMGS